MIFVTLGSQKFQFNRVLKALDRLVGDSKIDSEEIFAQIGFSDYEPKNFKFDKFLDRDDFQRLEREAEIVIAHGGTGAIVGALKAGSKVIAVPRLKKFGEHVDNHQVQALDEFRKSNLILVCNDCNILDKLIIEARQKQFNKFESNTDEIVDCIDNFILSN